MSKSNAQFMEFWTPYSELMYDQENFNRAEPEGVPDNQATLSQNQEEEIMPNVDEIYPNAKGSHLKASDLNGKEIKATIDGYEIVEFPNEKGIEKKVVLKFTKTDKTLVMNKTNSRAIAGAFGGEIDGWIGKEINIFPTTTDYAGTTVDCIRVRPELEKAGFDDGFDQDSSIPF